ncbi:MAG TPA: A24 family peptidase [Terriglobales bacterium]|jgi:prepilin peptidase CpaA|nr:A24 family peptidase [Terriglobales bacterium]
MQGFPLQTAYSAAAFACAAMGAVCDVRTHRIPNWLTGSGIALGLVLHVSLGGLRSVAGAALGGLISGTVFLVFYLAGGMGAGDVKLMTAVCCLAGAGGAASILLATALLGGALAIGPAVLRGRVRETVVNLGRLLLHHGTTGLRSHPDLNLLNPQTLRLPYGLAIAAGAGSSLCSVLLR